MGSEVRKASLNYEGVEVFALKGVVLQPKLNLCRLVRDQPSSGRPRIQ